MKSKIYKSLSAACVLTFGFTVTAAQNPSTNPQPRPSDSTRPSVPSATPHHTSAPVTLTGCLVRDTGTDRDVSVGAGAQSGRGAQRPAEASQAAAMFKLTNVEMDSRAASAGASPAQGGVSSSPSNQAPSSPHQAAGAAGSTAHASEYRLVPGANVDLSAHLNHRVSVTGTRSELSTGSAGTPPGMSSGSAQSPGSGSSSNSGSGSAGAHSPSGSASSSGPASSQQPASGQPGRMTGQHDGSMSHGANIPTLMVTNVTMIASTCQ